MTRAQIDNGVQRRQHRCLRVWLCARSSGEARRLWVPKIPYGAETSLRVEPCFITIAPSLHSASIVAEQVAGSQDGSAGVERRGRGTATVRRGLAGAGGSAHEEESGRCPLVVVVQTAQVLDLDQAAALARMNVSTGRAVHA